MFCKATKIDPFPIRQSAWDEFPWKNIPALPIRNHMGKKPAHFPEAAVKIAHDSQSVYVMFRVEDRYVRATALAHQDSVYRDSCVEFFFTPGAEVSEGYFNLEMNCGGTLLFNFQEQPGINKTILPEEECKNITGMHSLPSIVDPEITEPVTWTVAYTVPISLLEKYCRVMPPGPQTVWRVNFYKCADDSSHPHWLTWSPVDLPYPNFHHPRSFGILTFE